MDADDNEDMELVLSVALFAGEDATPPPPLPPPPPGVEGVAALFAGEDATPPPPPPPGVEGVAAPGVDGCCCCCCCMAEDVVEGVEEGV